LRKLPTARPGTNAAAARATLIALGRRWRS
jgi:hypothetical protein